MDLRSVDLSQLPEAVRNRLTAATPKEQVSEVLGVKDEVPVADVAANITRITGLPPGQPQRPTRPASGSIPVNPMPWPGNHDAHGEGQPLPTTVPPAATLPEPARIPISEDDEDIPSQAQSYIVTLHLTTHADPTELCQVRLRRYTQEEPRVLMVYRL